MATALQELLAKRAAQSGPGATADVAVSTDPSSPTGDPAPEDSPAAAQGNEPYGVAQVVTPSGLEIYFQAGPKRLYKLRDINIADSARTTPLALAEWLEVPSMSDVKDVLDKAGLPWWGMKVGVQGVATLLDQASTDAEMDMIMLALQSNDVDLLVSLLTKRKLTVNHTRDKAGDRGTSVHKALEGWAEKGTIPIPDVYPEHERGYVQGVVDFLQHSGAEPLASEVMVGSLEWGFAGRFDLIARIPNNAEVYVHRTEKGRGDRMEKIPGGRWLLDLKTSKDVYASHQLQCAGYELAYQESYGERTDYQGVIQVPEDGRYKLVKSRATIDHFQSLKGLYDALKEIG